MAAKKGFVKMKPIPKENLDELIPLDEKSIGAQATSTFFQPRDMRVTAVFEYSRRCLCLSAFRNIVNAMFSGHGLKPNATYQDVYDVFALLGYEVVSEPEGSEDEPV
jgi:hypothetical protein